VETGKELAEQIAQLLLPVGREMGPHRRRAGLRLQGTLTSPVDTVRDTKVLLMVVGGKVVFERKQWHLGGQKFSYFAFTIRKWYFTPASGLLPKSPSVSLILSTTFT
jgi:hypothetical protein